MLEAFKIHDRLLCIAVKSGVGSMRTIVLSLGQAIDVIGDRLSD